MTFVQLKRIETTCDPRQILPREISQIKEIRPECFRETVFSFYVW